MSNLASLKSELLLDYSEEDHIRWLGSNFYMHHNLPSRTVPRAKDNRHGLSASKLPLTLPSQPIVGRKLFQYPSQQLLPGPGTYDSPLRKYSSHCYIKKQETHVLSKIAKRLRRRSIINECRGPGLYNPESAFQATSKSKPQSQGSFSQSPLKRMLLSKQQLQKLYLIQSSQTQRQFLNKKSKAKVSMNPSLIENTSNHSKAITHRMSSTQRSSIINQNMVPGPGFYNCYQSSLRLGKTAKPKGHIQFKFVHGHPS